MAWDAHDEEDGSFQTEDGVYVALVDPVYGYFSVRCADTDTILGEVATLQAATVLVEQHRANPAAFSG